MQNILLYIYYATLGIAAINGMYKYKCFDKPMRVITCLLALTFLSEVSSYILFKNEEYIIRYGLIHFYSIMQLWLICIFFILKTIPDYHKKLILAASILCISIGLLNIIFLQPLFAINSNMLMFECLAITTLCMHHIYTVVKSENQSNIFRSPHTQVTLILLISWSTTFFFWAFIEILYNEGWRYSTTIINAHIMINILVYAGIAAVFYFYPKKHIAHEHS